MADVTISELTAASAVQDADLFVLEQSGVAKKLTGSIWGNWILNKIGGLGTITNIQKTGTSGTNPVVDTYTITFVKTEDIGDDNPTGTPYTFTFNVTNGKKGDTGATGATGPASQITSREVLYQESTSGTVPNGNWSSSVPTVSAGNYLWTHITITFDSGSVDWYEVQRQPIDGNGSVSKVNSISPDGNGNIALTASNIPYNSSDVGTELASLASAIGGSQSEITATGILKGTGSGVVTAATLGTDYGAMSHTITVYAANWTASGSLYTTTVINNILFVASGYDYAVSPHPDSYDDFCDAGIRATAVSNGNITLVASYLPTADIKVNFQRIKSTAPGV